MKEGYIKKNSINEVSINNLVAIRRQPRLRTNFTRKTPNNLCKTQSKKNLNKAHTQSVKV